ncbi:hypothetical protein YC2023_004173 [Brassica napus]
MMSWSCHQTCGARGAATHASGAMRSDTRAATRLVSDCYSTDFKSAPREGSGQLKINQLKINSDGKQVNVASSVQSAILYDCDAEALSNSIRPSQSYSPTIKWRCCPRLVQFHGFRSVEVLLDAPRESPKNCRGAKEGSVQISRSRRVSFFMMKPRLCPSQDQSSPVQSRCPLGFGQVLYDQPAASRLEHCHIGRTTGTMVSLVESCLVRIWNFIFSDPKDCGLSRGDPNDCGPRSVESSFFWPLWVVDIKAMRFPLLEARSWQEAKSNLVTVALGKDDRIASCWTLGPPAGTGLQLYQCRGRGVKFVTLTRLSLARHVALPDHGVGLDGQSCSCLIVGWPVGLSSPTLGVGRLSVMFLFDCWPVGRPMRRTACFEHSNFFKVTAPEARPGQLRPGAYRRQKRQADRNWKTDETRPRPCKRENLKLGAKRSTGKFAGKVPGKFTGDNPAIDLNPALDSVGPNSPTLCTRTVRVLGVHTDVRVCPSAHTGRPWPSVSTHRTSGCPSVHISARSVDCSGDFGPRGLSVQYTQDVRQHTQDVRGCPCVSVCPSVHTGRPSAHAGRPSAHAGRPWLSVCLRVSVSAHRTSVSTHRTSVSTRRTSVSTRRTSVAVRVCPCVRQCTQDVRQHTQDVRQHTQDVRGCPCVSVCPSAHAGRPSAHAGRPSAHAGRPCLSVSTHRLSVD